MDGNRRLNLGQDFTAAGLEMAQAGLAAVGTEVSADFVAGSSLRKQFLSTVAGTPDIAGRSLATVLGKEGHPLDEGQLSRVAKGLSDRGLVDRRKVGRRVLWRLTPRGNRVLDLLKLAPVASLQSELGENHSSQDLAILLAEFKLEASPEPCEARVGSASFVSILQPDGSLDLFIEDTNLDTDMLGIVLRQSERAFYGRFTDGFVHFERIKPGVYYGTLTKLHNVAGSELVDVETQTPVYATAFSAPTVAQDFRTADGALHVEIQVRPDQAVEAAFETTASRWAGEAAVLQWTREDGVDETIIAPLSEVGDGIWRGSVLLEGVGESGQFQVPTEPMFWHDLPAYDDMAGIVTRSISAASDFPEALSGWCQVCEQLDEPVRSEATATLQEYGYC
ncbi:Mycobacterium numidiamassiliense ORFan [Mycobacterium numidiamassiliense]|uniref:Mycobacterium numidiamassiliense ORFan n=2 Tax=Mycobacterium numidiamassiliense TaxID=1841861 RepID=A0A2U3P9Y2_9MYCO|nr:Mycobacterium numidiamassiliense ORFan [Mycobacterium numidiamassiliense]